MISSSEINNLVTLHAMFLAFLHTRLTGPSFSDEKGCWKTNEVPKQFGLLHNEKNNKTTGPLVLTSELF